MILSIGALLGFFSVAFGAYAEHGLRSKLSETAFNQIMVALKYNQIHAVVLVSLGLFLLSNFEHKIYKVVNISSWLFIIGIFLFSFSIYASKILQIDVLTKLAPMGGMTLMTAWLCLVYAGIIGMKD